MPRFFLEKMNNENPVLTGGDARHIGFSLRMKPGDRLTVCAEGIDHECAVKRITENAVYLDILGSSPCAAEPDIKLVLYQAVPKSDKFETIIQKSIELGVSEIVPVLTRRCVSRPTSADFLKKLERLNKIALSAAKQSGRGIVPQVMPMIDFKTAVSQMSQNDCPIMLYEEGGMRFSQLDTISKKSFSLMIGSEGGFDSEEVQYAEKAGINTVWLGKRILRCETAPLTAISILMFITKNL